MCGIVGIVDRRVRDLPPELISRMRDVMFFRGPDGIGDYRDGNLAMSMRRLSVIDLKGGWQPLTSAGGRVIAFQNGEIYNYRALRTELENNGFPFKTRCDTEVLAHGYVRWGIEGLLERIDGMYAIAILDKVTGRLHIARDRFGEKPLFYCMAEGRFAYASNLPALAALPWVDDGIDPVALDRYLAVHYVPGEGTIVRGIKRVLQGERVELDLGTMAVRKERYHCVSVESGENIDDDRLASLVEEAVRSRLEAEVPVGVFLSGGLDSSVVAFLAAKYMPGIDTFSIGFEDPERDESPFARMLAEKVGSRHHHFLFDATAFEDLIPRVTEGLDEPLGDQAILPMYWLCREARKDVTVVLSGEGADEIFAGYDYYREMAAQVSGDPTLSTFCCNARPVTPSGFPLLFDSAMRRRILVSRPPIRDKWEEDWVAWLAKTSGPLQRATCADLYSWLSDDLLVKYDRMAMIHSLEGRAPFLHPELVDAAMRKLPPEERMNGHQSKVAFRRIAARWLPKEILSREKQGFVLPMAAWIRDWFSVRGGAGRYLRCHGLRDLDTEGLVKVVEEALLTGGGERLVFAVIMLVEWYHSFQRRVGALKRSYSFYGYG